MAFYGRIEGDDRPTKELPRFCHVEEFRTYIQEVDFYGYQEDTYDPDHAYEVWLENGGAHADQIAWEHEQDRLMHPFDPQGA